MDNNRANVEDIYYLLECAEKATDTSEKEHYRIILDLIETKNPETMEKIRRDNDMARSGCTRKSVVNFYDTVSLMSG